MIHTETTVTTYLRQWCADHLGRHDSPAFQDYTNHFARFLKVKRAEQLRPHGTPGRFGMSSVGGCLRASALRLAGAPARPDSGDTMQTFEIGHLLEVQGLALLAASGFNITDTQHPVTIGPFSSAADGVLRGGPVALPYPLLLSVKTASYKSSGRQGKDFKRYGFTGLPLDGIRKAEPGWWLQSQLEMLASGIASTLTLVLAKDMIRVFDDDAVMTESGSLSFYAELLAVADPAETETLRNVYTQTAAGIAAGVAAEITPAYYYKETGGAFVPLPSPGDIASKWGGPNQQATGRFNPCFGCRYAGNPEVCR